MNEKKYNNIIIFIRIPKTASTTFTSIFNQNYNRNEIFSFRFLGIRKEIYGNTNINKLLNNLSQIKFIEGHIPFGIHSYIDKTVKYFTILRNPINRIVSLYYHYSRPDHILYKKVKQMSFIEFINSDLVSDLDNGQIRYLSGMNTISTMPITDLVSQDNFEQAKLNISKYFIAVGLCEFFDQSLILLRNYISLKKYYYYKQNITSNKLKSNLINDEISIIIKSKNKYDFMLYQLVQNSFFKELKQVNNYYLKLLILKQTNYLYRLYLSLK